MASPTGYARRLSAAFGEAAALVQAWFGDQVTIAGMRLRVPGTRRIRLSVVAGNRRVHRLIDAATQPGALIVDVGAHTGFNTVHAAQRVGTHGRVVAVEPTDDARAVLLENINANHLTNVTVWAGAAGAARGEREFFVRGGVSAVNSLFRESFYAPVTSIVRVAVAPLDEIVEGTPDLVKIDVEGGELEVLAGMTRMLGSPGIQLIVEWHPILQVAAGYAADALPRWLLDKGFLLTAAGHFKTEPLVAAGIERLTERLRASRRPVELVARRA
jgi:FkbM family methyltransferase